MSFPTAFNIVRLFVKHPSYTQNLIKNKIKLYQRFQWIDQNINQQKSPLLPLVYRVSLTLKCNLRCKACMEWGDVGWCKDEPREKVSNELEWDVLKKTIEDVAYYHPSFIFSGGEPLLYSHFNELAELLKSKKCFATICTNGLLLDKFIKTASDNPYLTFLVSLDGFKKENDFLRGKGVFDRVINNIKLLKSLKRPPYIGIQFTIRPENVETMHPFCEEMVKLNVDWILLNPFWFINPEQAKGYEAIMASSFNVIPKTHLGYLVPYSLNKEEFVKQFQKIRRQSWPIQISCYLKKPEDIYTYIEKPEALLYSKLCYKQWLRMDITSSGDVTPCSQFPDLTLGNLKEKSVSQIWEGGSYGSFRKLIQEKMLPICSKCNEYYLYDKRKNL